MRKLTFLLISFLVVNSAHAEIINSFQSINNSKERTTHFKKAHEVGLMLGALKYANFGLHYQYSLSPIKWITFQGGVGLNFMHYDVYSASDKHRIQVAWLPVSFGSRVNLLRKNNYNGYLFGKYGWAIGLGNNNNKLKSNPCLEYGVGALLSVFNDRNALLKLEFGKQEYTLKGKATSTYQSNIDYDLLFRSYFLNVGLVFLID